MSEKDRDGCPKIVNIGSAKVCDDIAAFRSGCFLTRMVSLDGLVLRKKKVRVQKEVIIRFCLLRRLNSGSSLR